MYDIAIIGLGPAGSTAARLLGKHFSTAALDLKSEREDSFRKPCGGLLAPDAQKALARFSLTLPKEVLVNPQIFSVRTIDLDSGNTRYYQRFYVNIDRHKFDLWMDSMIPDEVDLFRAARCTDIEAIPGGYRIRFSQDGVSRQIEAARILGADGANSTVRRIFFPEKKIRRYVALQQWFPERHATPFYSCIFDSSATDCYSWSISKDGYFIFGGAYPAQDCRARFERQKEKLGAMGFHFGEPLKTEACLVLRPASPWQFCTGSDTVFLLGEAAGFISPSSLEGISSAITSAALLSEILRENRRNPGSAYRRKSSMLRLKHTCKLLKCPFMFDPILRKAVRRSGLLAIPVNEE